ncbi:MAG: efflux RND transporter periplasmic adaptor subunit [Halioglobus sp.]|nr:efflux RND transporter periplasmic adaptor subunit [Halioglobus sp.]
MSRNVITASVFVAALLLWMGSGELRGGENATAQPVVSVAEPVQPLPAEGELNRVRVAIIDAQPRTRSVVLRGRTESKRVVDVKAEVAGSVVARPVERGMQVAQGDLLCELAVDDREVALREARAALETARIEHEGSLKLREQGLLSEVAIANSQARKEAARAHLRRQELNLARTRITAPFDGVVEDLQMNVGDYAVSGASCATLIDLDPMLVRADVTETEVDKLVPGQAVTGTSSVGRELDGIVSFVGKQSDPVTRTYPVEITVDNADYSIRSGLTVSLRIGVESVPAHRVASSLLSLDDAGVMGIRTLDAANRVVFTPVEILEDGADGVWVTGLADTVNLITVGQEYVALGEVVEPVFTGPAGRNQLAGL